ncbi:MAG: hypothetical protein A2413_14490 [Treponema sp. RIFOXYC1_FULL_61_9]|nr:MAG: hypothetical protein A2413_14490 [Treponema sp. RIFOXYC1_FULL_61_9]
MDRNESGPDSVHSNRSASNEAADGAAHMPVVYGTILTAWSAAGIAGPQIVAALKDRMPMYAATATFAIGAALLASGFALTFLLGRKKE